MKICWDNLEGIYLSVNGGLKKGHHFYIERDSCKYCGNPFLMNKHAPSEFCGLSCFRLGHMEDLTNRKFNRLLVLGFEGIINKESHWKCVCDCGNKTVVRTADLKSGNTKSCGCFSRETASRRGKLQIGKGSLWYKHGLSDTKAYMCASTAKYRSTKKNQTPDGANLQKIQLYYTVCAYLNSNCEIPAWHVDHIKPISKGGLHHEDNLQILTAAINLQKSAKYPLTEEEQVWYKGVTI